MATVCVFPVDDLSDGGIKQQQCPYPYLLTHCVGNLLGALLYGVFPISFAARQLHSTMRRGCLSDTVSLLSGQSLHRMDLLWFFMRRTGESHLYTYPLLCTRSVGIDVDQTTDTLVENVPRFPLGYHHAVLVGLLLADLSRGLHMAHRPFRLVDRLPTSD